MMYRFLVFLLLYSLFFLINSQSSRFSKMTKKVPSKPVPKPVINYDALPALEDVLKSLNLFQHAKKFYEKGVVDSRILVRLSRMDFQLMELDWKGYISIVYNTIYSISSNFMVSLFCFFRNNNQRTNKCSEGESCQYDSRGHSD